MLGTRYEEYGQKLGELPFVLNLDIKRNQYNLSKQANWHENLEMQVCVSGNGTVLSDGKKHTFNKNDIAVINSNAIHYTATDTELIYDVIIISTDFCKQMGFDSINYNPVFKSHKILTLFENLKKIYSDPNTVYRTAKLNSLLLEIMLELSVNHKVNATNPEEKNKNYERVKSALLYIRENYTRKITLDEIAKAVYCDKYTLCKDFKKYTGQTVFENLNHYRCVKAIDCLKTGSTVSETASLCGFDNFSFFTKTFKKYIGRLPSKYKNL